MSQLKQILEELERRARKERPPRELFVDYNFPKQVEIIKDKSRSIGIQCTRRAGKSIGVAKKYCDTAEKEPGTKQVYAGLTLPSVKEIIWEPFLTELENEKIPHRANETKGMITLKNGSRIRLAGVDCSYKEMAKLLGGKLRRFALDEAGSVTIDCQKLIYQIVKPALIDLQGEAIMLGTAENIPNTFFEKVMSGREPGWSLHKYTTHDNPYMRDLWIKEIDEILKNNPLAAQASWFRTHYLNEWCHSDELLIYKLNDYNYCDILPKLEQYILGVDLGYNDASSFAVLGYRYDSKKLYIVETTKETELDFTDVANRIKSIMSKYPISKVIIDGANKQGVEEMRKRHQLPLDEADKKDKVTFIRMLRDDFLTSTIQIFKKQSEPFLEEASSLVWKNDERKEEDPRCQNHLCDAVLYAWRSCYNYLHDEVAPCQKTQSQREMDELEKREMQEAQAEQNESNDLFSF